MAIDIDAVLLDRVFQPAANAVIGWASCFGLARAALVVAVEAQFLVLLWDVMRDVSPLSVTLSVSAAILTMVGAQQAWRMIMRTERQARPGTMNIRRVMMRRQRMIWLGVCTGCAGFLIPQGDIRAAFAILSCAAWIALIYFMSCTPLPPARQRSTRLVPAGATSS